MMYNNNARRFFNQPRVVLTTRHAERFESHSFRPARADEILFRVFGATGDETDDDDDDDETDDETEPSRGAEDAFNPGVIQRRAFTTSRGRV